MWIKYWGNKILKKCHIDMWITDDLFFTQIYFI